MFTLKTFNFAQTNYCMYRLSEPCNNQSMIMSSFNSSACVFLHVKQEFKKHCVNVLKFYLILQCMSTAKGSFAFLMNPHYIWWLVFISCFEHGGGDPSNWFSRPKKKTITTTTTKQTKQDKSNMKKELAIRDGSLSYSPKVTAIDLTAIFYRQENVILYLMNYVELLLCQGYYQLGHWIVIFYRRRRGTLQ